MKLIIAGSRDLWVTSLWLDHTLVNFVPGYDSTETISEIVSGGAMGVDSCGELYASDHGLPIKRFDPAWAIHGKAAGPIRNREMAEYADALFLIWNGESKGSASMKREMQKLGKPIYEVILRKR